MYFLTEYGLFLIWLLHLDFNVRMRSSSVAICATVSKLRELLVWRPDLGFWDTHIKHKTH